MQAIHSGYPLSSTPVFHGVKSCNCQPQQHTQTLEV